MLLIFLTLLATAATTGTAQGATKSSRSFGIDYDLDTFVRDGEPVQLVSGTMHYFRIHPTDWVDRLRKLRYAGFNTVQTYIEWLSHEPKKGVFDFSGMNNFTEYVLTAQKEGLMVILRPGPYIDAERDMGGLPYWLLVDKDISLRTMDEAYIKHVDEYFNILLPMLKPLLYSQGGPVIMVQVENEYGSYPACDYSYTSHMRDLIRAGLGDDILLYSTDGSGTSYLKCGKIPEVYATIDFGTGANLTKVFGAQRLFEPRGPLMNSEFYPGWLDHWGSAHSTVTTEAVANSLNDMLAMNASVNVYVFHGGTSFGLTAGSNMGSEFQACPTSYDYDAPVTEAGDLTNKYYAIRDVVGKYLSLPSMTAPSNTTKAAYGPVPLTASGHLLDLTALLTAAGTGSPLSFEDLGLFNGVVVYETQITFSTSDPVLLQFTEVNDRGYVMVDGVLVGVLARQQKALSVTVRIKKGQRLTVVVESQGRVCYGIEIKDSKGLLGDITLGGTKLTNWTSTPVNLSDLRSLSTVLDVLSKAKTDRTASPAGGEMVFYSGTFQVPSDPGHPYDTFLRLDGWTKGIAWVNDFCLGRYWPVMGPQLTLFIPHGVLEVGTNTLTIFELEEAPCTSPETCTATLTDKHVINGPVPES